MRVVTSQLWGDRMFGMENQQKKKDLGFTFELEKEFKNAKTQKEYKDKIEQRIKKIKDCLRHGESKEEFDSFGALLHGYTSLLKVMSRFSAK